MNRKQVEEVKAQADKATRGPLTVRQSTRELLAGSRVLARFNEGPANDLHIPEGWRNMAFFAAARADVPALCETITEMHQLLRHLHPNEGYLFDAQCPVCQFLRDYEAE